MEYKRNESKSRLVKGKSMALPVFTLVVKKCNFMEQFNCQKANRNVNIQRKNFINANFHTFLKLNPSSPPAF